MRQTDSGWINLEMKQMQGTFADTFMILILEKLLGQNSRQRTRAESYFQAAVNAYRAGDVHYYVK